MLISIFFGKVSWDITGHIYSITNSFIEKSDKINEEKFSDEYKVSHWYFISNIEIVSPIPIKGWYSSGTQSKMGDFPPSTNRKGDLTSYLKTYKMKK